MKTTQRMAILAAATALSFGAVSGKAADVEGKAKIGTAEGKASANVNTDHRYDSTRSSSTASSSDRYTASDTRVEKSSVNDTHRASKLTGMKVKNDAGENLGNIEDLVVDLKSGKISYAVLGVGGFLGIGEKYIAVPPSAFRMGDDEKSLVLNADKAKLEAAPGFVKTNWPDYRNPDFGGEAFWTSDTSVGGSASITTGTEHGSSVKSSSTLDRKSYDRDLDKNKDRNSSVK